MSLHTFGWCWERILFARLRGVSTLREQFGRNLRRLRLKEDWTQEQMAERLGTSVNFLSFMERGIKAPSFENLERIAEVLNVAVAELFQLPATPVKQSQRVQRSTHGPKNLGRLRR